MTILIVVGLLTAAGGVLAYTGRWRSWTATYLVSQYEMFGLLFLGLGLVFGAPLAGLNSRYPVATGLSDVGVVVCWVLWILGLWRLPVLLRPRWFRAWQQRGAHRGEYARARSRRG